MVGGLLAVVILVGLVVDGGNLWAQQRIVQNGADAAAEAGAIVLAERLAGATEPAGGWDARVGDRVSASATANGLTIASRLLHGHLRIPLTSTGTAALSAGGREPRRRRPGRRRDPDEHGDRAGLSEPASLVRRRASSCWRPRTRAPTSPRRWASAPSASRSGRPPSRATSRASAMPARATGARCSSDYPGNMVTCDGQNRPLNTGIPWARHTVYKVPLCSDAPGNVGWLDWDPPARRSQRDLCSIENPTTRRSILRPGSTSSRPVTPTAVAGTATADHVDSVEDEIREYNGQVVFIPQFDVMCGTTTQPQPGRGTFELRMSCQTSSTAATATTSGTGSRAFAFFELCDPRSPSAAADRARISRATTVPSATRRQRLDRRVWSASSSTSCRRHRRGRRRWGTGLGQGARSAADQIDACPRGTQAGTIGVEDAAPEGAAFPVGAG